MQSGVQPTQSRENPFPRRSSASLFRPSNVRRSSSPTAFPRRAVEASRDYLLDKFGEPEPGWMAAGASN